MISGPAFETWSGLSVFVELFWKSGAVLGAALGASACLRRQPAALRRLGLSSAVVAMFLATILSPVLPRWNATAPSWLRIPSPAARAAITPSQETTAPEGAVAFLPQQLPAATRSSSNQSKVGAFAVLKHMPVILVIWFAGTAILLGRFLAGLRKLRRLRLSSAALGDEDMQRDVARIDPGRRVSLLRNEAIDAPVTWGILRPVILVPARFEQLSAECRAQVLCHELAHIQGHDFALRILVEIVQAAIWFQPLMWMVRRRLREEQELACDDRVLDAGGRPSAYARLLLDWDAGLIGRDSLIAIGMAQRSCLKRRLYALLDLNTRRDAVSRVRTRATLIFGLAVTLPLAAFDLDRTPAPNRHAAIQAAPAASPTAPGGALLTPPASPAPRQAAVAAMPPEQAAPRQLALATRAPSDLPPAEAASPVPAQSPIPDSQVVFEVASVKHGPPGDYSAGGNGGGPGTSKPTRWSVENYPMSSLLSIAYGVASYQLSGPGWLIDERFTVEAKVPEGATKEQLKFMLRNLLIERFKLSAHMETREYSGYQLVVGKGGPKLAVSPGEDKPDADPDKPAAPFQWKNDKDGFPELPPGRHYSMAISSGRARWRFADISMQGFASMLEDRQGYPIVDATGLTGKYDFEIFWAYPGSDGSIESGPSLSAAVQEQLGLKLESKRIPLDTVVIDHLEKMPSGN